LSVQEALRPSLARKSRVVSEVARLLREYPTVAVFSLTAVRANTVHEMRKKLRGGRRDQGFKEKDFHQGLQRGRQA
jgi:ribosomal protein L10